MRPAFHFMHKILIRQAVFKKMDEVSFELDVK
jgi:hypothetical protein